uniref:Acetyltransferase n=1 Tax=Oryza glumipatula TaxID=40148 RepID=A0A0E0AJX3_9ORYZ
MPPPPPPSPPVRVVSTRTVKPSPPRPRERIPLTTWDVSLLAADYIQKGLLFRPPPATLHLVEHLAAALADALHVYYPVAGRFVTDKHPGGGGGCSVSIDCDGQGAQIVHAIADGVSMADILPPDVDVPTGLVRSFFPLDDAVNYDGHELPLFVVQVTELVDGGVFLGFMYNHALSDGTAFWDFLNAWAEIARARVENARPALAAVATSRAPLLERWSPDGGAAAPVVLPYDDLAGLIARTTTTTTPPLLRERMLHFSAESLAALKERARRELLAAGDAAGAAAVTRFQALSSLLWRSPRFDMYGCDFGWGKAVAARSGKGNKYDGKVSLFPGRDGGGGGIDAEVELAPEHMAALEEDGEFWAAVTPDHLLLVNDDNKA